MGKRRELVNVFKFLGILCAFALGYITIVATSSEDVAEDLGLDFDTNETIELEEVSVEKQGGVVQGLATDVDSDGCPETSINGELASLPGEVSDYVDNIKVIDLNDAGAVVQVSGVTILGPSSTMNCSLSISGNGVTTVAGVSSYVLVSYDITGNMNPTDITLTGGVTAYDIIDWYLDHRDSSFEYCLECTGDSDFTDYDVEFGPYFDVYIEVDL